MTQADNTKHTEKSRRLEKEDCGGEPDYTRARESSDPNHYRSSGGSRPSDGLIKSIRRANSREAFRNLLCAKNRLDLLLMRRCELVGACACACLWSAAVTQQREQHRCRKKERKRQRCRSFLWGLPSFSLQECRGIKAYSGGPWMGGSGRCRRCLCVP